MVMQSLTSWDVSAGISMLPPDSFMSNLYSQLRYFIGEFHALQLIVLAVFGAMD